MAQMSKIIKSKAKEKFGEKYKFWVMKFVDARIKRKNKKLKEQNYKCFYCGIKLSDRESTYDHIIPTSKGGNESPNNFVCSCKECNRIRGTIPFEVFVNIVSCEEDKTSIREYNSFISKRIKKLEYEKGLIYRDKLKSKQLKKKDKSYSEKHELLILEYNYINQKLLSLKRNRWFTLNKRID